MAEAIAAPLSRSYARRGGEPSRLRAGVEAWRRDLGACVAGEVAAALDWDEGSGVQFTSDLGASGWRALRLFAHYAERPELDLPDGVPALLELDADWRRAHDMKFRESRFGQLLAAELWLPGDFPLTLRAPLPDGSSGEIGSLLVLADQLRWLNQRTFQAGAAELKQWCELPAGPDGALLDAARRGYAGLCAAVSAALAARLPVVIVEA